jgi:hypothetical protein
MKSLFFFISFFLFLENAIALQWQKIDIPGAVCGNGEQYSVFLDRKDLDKLVVEFMAGGACWNEFTCYSRAALASLEPLRGDPPKDLLTAEDESNPWSHHTTLYFPYCTGDAFSADHVGMYKPGVPIYHVGYNNVHLAIDYLLQNQIIQFNLVQNLTVWGASAGALGAFVHARNFEALVSPTAKKTLISDCPGLHFGRNFWHKFSNKMNRDFKKYLGKVGMVYSEDDGFIAPLMGPVFQFYRNWNIGILQSTKDLVMSVVFGSISPDDHRKLVLGPQGISEIAKNYPHVSTWIADSSMHTFLLTTRTGDMVSMQGETAWNYVVRIYTEKTQ